MTEAVAAQAAGVTADDLGGQTIPEALRQAAAEWPDRRAISFITTGVALTFAELDEQSQRIAAGLVGLGVRPGDRVGLLLRNEPAFPLAWLGIIAARAVAVPINPRLTAREVDFILEDTGTTMVLAAEDLVAHLLPGLEPARVGAGPQVTRLDRAASGWVTLDELCREEPLPRPVADPGDLVSIQFTSGSTGLPKGCMLDHDYWLILGHVCNVLAESSEHILADHPFYYMQNQMYLAMGIMGGGEVHVTDGLSRRRFVGWLRDYAIDFAWVSDGLLEGESVEGENDHVLRFAPTDAIIPGLHAELERRYGMTVREWYGSTEVGIGTFVPWADTASVGSGSMGWCMPGRESRVIDENLHEVPPGEIGELCFRGRGVTRGYYNRAETNAALLLPGGWFRTGDLVRKTEIGEHFFVGRVKEIIRRSGENISAYEVEQQLATHPLVADVAVVPEPDRSRGEEVKAVVVPVHGALPTARELDDWCRERLAAFKVPRFYEFRNELPKTPSGKTAKPELVGADDTGLLGPRVDVLQEI